ncbi:GCN5-related N-acetyltransferase [Prochlorococcus marinus str. MIT 9313]|uniref:GCN5-related N-acetyltransferase n=1 Tax=Prochlorococcus marinus (strain MIT 9313) TaxID=74547 RepID=Q7V861_PROMM|nr:GNAT family N-acetyltransferase [Prochlorococcus marinus]CAE20685.1 GCN5-related N-acetyltransferase [Prochlorococcus marinus str. MIT 9313]
MASLLKIRPLQRNDIAMVTQWARAEGFAPGVGDVSIYRHTDRQGLWVGWLGNQPVGCIAGVRYNAAYGFIGLFLVIPEHRGHGYGVELWEHALEHLVDLPCVGLEAAYDRIDDYAGWGFAISSPTTRWQRICDGNLNDDDDYSNGEGLQLLEGDSIPAMAVQSYDAIREPSPRPHFLSDWLQHPAGNVLALVDGNDCCHGFGRIRPCLLRDGEGWRIGPLLADSPQLAELLLKRLIQRHPGVVILDAPGGNSSAEPLLKRLGFSAVSQTLRMYRGEQPSIPLDEVYGLACLELG